MRYFAIKRLLHFVRQIYTRYILIRTVCSLQLLRPHCLATFLFSIPFKSSLKYPSFKRKKYDPARLQRTGLWIQSEPRFRLDQPLSYRSGILYVVQETARPSLIDRVSSARKRKRKQVEREGRARATARTRESERTFGA